MEDIRPEDQAALRQNLRTERIKLDELVRALHAIDATLEGLDAERSKYALLATACNALHELDAMGGASLFWSERDQGIPAADLLRQVRSRVDEFEKQLALVEERRQTLLEEIEIQQDRADGVAGYLLDAERIADEKKYEWLIEREAGPTPLRPGVMPWARGQEDDRRFRRTLFAALVASALLGFLLPLVEIPIPERWQIVEEQERLTQLVREEIPLPPVVVSEEKPAEPVLADELAPSSDDSEAPLIADKAQAESNPAPAATKQAAGSKGILAFREKFSGLASNDAVERLGSNARIQDPTAVSDGLPERSLVTSQAPGASGGINVAALSRGTGGTGTQLSGVAVTRATSTLGTDSYSSMTEILCLASEQALIFSASPTSRSASKGSKRPPTFA